ncbi:MAG: hypothetical protein V3S74_04455 [Alphaproteobacteria bacterium]
MTQEKQSIVDEIEKAFRDTSRPDVSNIVVEFELDPERSELRDRLKNLHWSEIPVYWGKVFPPEPFLHHGDDLIPLTPEGLRYFLPGYMISCILYPDEVDVMLQYVGDFLTPPRPGSCDEQFFAELVSGLSRYQGEAICRFMKFLLDEYHSDDGPDSDIFSAVEYWEKFGKR